MSPLDVTLEQALELLAQPKALRRGFGAPKEPLKVFDESPVTGQKMQLLEGRYGPYVTDGVTNASLPKGASPEELTKEEALELLAARAALGPSKKQSRRKAAQPKRSAKGAKSAAAKTLPIDAAESVNGQSARPARKSAKKKSPAKQKATAQKRGHSTF